MERPRHQLQTDYVDLLQLHGAYRVDMAALHDELPTQVRTT
jgi:hypothetical protein